jgi:hypothetical protein
VKYRQAGDTRIGRLVEGTTATKASDRPTIQPAVSAPSVFPCLPAEMLLYDIPTAARLMSCSTWALRTLCRTKQIAYIRIGHKFLISPDAIRAFVRKQEQAVLA